MHVPCGSQTLHDPRLPRQREGPHDERAGSRPRRDHTDQGLENHGIPLSALGPSGAGRTDERHVVLDTSSHSRPHPPLPVPYANPCRANTEAVTSINAPSTSSPFTFAFDFTIKGDHSGYIVTEMVT